MQQQKFVQGMIECQFKRYYYSCQALTVSIALSALFSNLIIIIIRNEYDYGGVMSEDC